MSLAINFAKALGWNSIAAAAVFSVLYSPLLVYFLSMIIKERRRVLFSLTLFCLSTFYLFWLGIFRFLQNLQFELLHLLCVPSQLESRLRGRMKACLLQQKFCLVSGSSDYFIVAILCVWTGKDLLILSLTLLIVIPQRLDLCQDTSLPVPIIGNILHLLRNRRLFRIALLIPMALGIAGINEASSNPSSSIGTSLRKASAIVFLVLTIIQVLQTIVLIKAERESELNSSSFIEEFSWINLPYRSWPFAKQLILLWCYPCFIPIRNHCLAPSRPWNLHCDHNQQHS